MIRKPKLVTAVAAAALLALSGCTNDGDDTAAGATTSASTTAVEEAGTDTSNAAAEHSEADVMFAQMMMPHHQQAIEMSDIILAENGIPEDVTTLAEEIKNAQGPEIAQLTEWLNGWGEPTEPQGGGHGGHNMAEMDGMLSDDELQQLSDAEGTDAARLFLEQMIAHHEGAITMAEDEVENGSFQPAVELAQTIIDTQQQEIDTMRDLLNSL